jgi:hypothetical protein
MSGLYDVLWRGEMDADVEQENRTVSVWEIQALLQENSEQLWAGLNWLSTGSNGGFRNRLAKTCCLE